MATLFSDSFTGANQTLAAYSGNWSQPVAQFNIVSNQLAQVGGVGNFRNALTTTGAHAATADVKCTVKVVTGAGFDGGPGVRFTSNTDGYYADVEAALGTVTLYRRVGGVDTSLGTRSITHAANDTYGIEASGTGATVTIKLYKNGSQLGANFTDSNAARITIAGRTAICSFGAFTFDDFLVESLSGGGASITGTGAITSSVSTASGSGTHDHVASGNPTITQATVAGSGVKGIFGTGAVTMPGPPIVNSSTGAAKTGTGAINSSKATSSGVAVHGMVDMPGDIALAFAGGFAVAGTALIGSARTASGAITSSKATVAGTAAKGRSTSGTLTGPVAAVAGTAFIGRGLTGTGAIVSSRATAAGTSTFGHAGTGALTGPKATVTGTGGGAGGGGAGQTEHKVSRAMSRKKAVRSAHGWRGQWPS